MSARSNRYPLGAMFAGSLVLSWTLMTLSVALTIWSDRHAPAARLASWVSLWAFTVLAPTLSALTLHRSIARLSGSPVAGDPSIAELARLRSFVVLSANMALLSACALVFGR